LSTWTAGCNPATLANTTHATGGARSIAIVDAYDYPNAQTDLAAFSTKFGIAAINTTNFTKVYASGTDPGPDPNCAGSNGWNCWSAEAALDIEMAHALAPLAHIYLVEANSDSDTDLYAAVTKAVSLITTSPNTGGEVSMSWGGSEYSGETSSDSTFTGTNVVFFASTGDSEGTEYPSVSPNVVAVGGTTLSRSPSTGNIEEEISWEDGGGGYSLYEPEPSYQDVIFGTGAGYARGVPDVALEGNPRTGVWVYDSYETPNYLGVANWLIFGGTSVASPLMAGVVNHAGHFAASTAAEQTMIYGNDQLSPNFRDIEYGSCGYYEGWFAVPGWDPCTGIGSPYGNTGK
jgi:subtilase family serine protease